MTATIFKEGRTFGKGGGRRRAKSGFGAVEVGGMPTL
jgi:hypothetical protein